MAAHASAVQVLSAVTRRCCTLRAATSSTSMSPRTGINNNTSFFQSTLTKRRHSPPGHARQVIVHAKGKKPGGAAKGGGAESADSAADAGAQHVDVSDLIGRCGFLCSVQSGKKDALQAVKEAKAIVEPVERVPPPTDHLPPLFDASHALHDQGETGVTFLPVNLTEAEMDEHAPYSPVVVFGQMAISNYVESLDEASSMPQYLARMMPVEKVCPATVEDVVRAVELLLPQHFAPPHGRDFVTGAVSREAGGDYDRPTKFAVHYEHHGKTNLHREEVVEAVAKLLPEPAYKVDLKDEELTIVVSVYHSVALVSILPGWHDMRHYNVHELAEQKMTANASVKTM